MRRAASLTLLSATIAVSMVACDDEAPPSTQGVGQALVNPPPRARSNDSIYDAEGVLRESDTVVVGLTLPLGVEAAEELSTDRRHVYYSDVPPAKLLRYFGPRLNTVNVEHEGDRVTYREATPQGVRGGVVKLDVTIQPTSARPSLVEILERPPPPPDGVDIPESEIRAHLDTLQPERRE